MTPAIAKQIADLLNAENQLVVSYTEKKILSKREYYLFELDENGNVTACIECKKVQWYQYEVCHLTVNPKMRRGGQGNKILNKALKHAMDNGGRVVQCTIREGNVASTGLFEKNGFKKVSVFYYPESGNNVGVWQKVICNTKQQGNKA